MRTSICCILISVASFTASPAFGIVIELRPISATGPFDIVDNEIRIPEGGVSVTLEIRVSGWGPERLRAFEAGIDPAGYTSGDGTLSPVVIPSPAVGAFIDTSRPDYVFAAIESIEVVRTIVDDYAFIGATLGGCRSSGGGSQYVGTLVLNVSDGASGLFTVGFRPPPRSMGLVCPNSPAPVELIPATIRIGDNGGVPCLLPTDCTNFCDEHPALCSSIPGFDIGIGIDELEVICWHWPCRLLDPLPMNCTVKWPAGCPGCSDGLCPPFYTMQFDGLEDAWTVGIVDVYGKPVPFTTIERGGSTIISFRPSKEGYIEGSIGNYMLAFDLTSKKHVGKKFVIGTKLIDVGDRPRLPQK